MKDEEQSSKKKKTRKALPRIKTLKRTEEAKKVSAGIDGVPEKTQLCNIHLSVVGQQFCVPEE
jgi:hypothetical protein